MPSNYTPVATVHATVTVPVDGDAPNASSVSTPLEQLADNIALTQATYVPLVGTAGVGPVTGPIVLSGGGEIDDENANGIPGLISLVQAAAGHKKQLAQWSTGPAVSGHNPGAGLYTSSVGTDGALEMVHNALWNDAAGTWGYIDTTHAAATRWTLSAAGGVIVQTYSGANFWADGAWVTQTTLGGANAGVEALATATTLGMHVVASAAQNGISATTAAAGNAVNASTSSTGCGVKANTTSGGSALKGTTTGAGDGVTAGTTGAGTALSATATSTGYALGAVSTGSGITANIDASAGTGTALAVTGNGSAAAVSVSSTGSASAVNGAAFGSGSGVIGSAAVGGSGAGVVGNAFGSGPSVDGDSSLGTGWGGKFVGNATKVALHLNPIVTASLPMVGSGGDIQIADAGGVFHLVFWNGTGWSTYA
jgi:hypothetical protein